MENLMFPMEFLRVTQKSGVGSHLGSLALDLGGKDTGIDRIMAPCSGTIVRVRENANGEVYLKSDGPVLLASGKVAENGVLVTLIHDNHINVKQGQHVKQGEYFYDEGGMSHGVAGYYGSHLHIELSDGKASPMQAKNRFGAYCTPLQISIPDGMMLGNDVQVLDGGGYNWHRRVDVVGNNGTADPAPAPTVSNTYTVQRGDSWWSIAKSQLGSGTKCALLAKANGKTIYTTIHPSDVLVLPEV